MKTALPHVQETIYLLNERDLEEGREGARNSPRRRIILPIHRKLGDGVQRFLNFLQPGTYVAPHYHSAAGFSETILVMAGKVAFFEFDEVGGIQNQQVIQAGMPGCLVDFIGTVTHTFICLQEDTIVLEVKKGPYDARGDKVFAPWAPPEGDPGALDYLRKLELSISQK